MTAAISVNGDSRPWRAQTMLDLLGEEGIAVANYAKEHPDKTFINGTSGAQDTTLKVQAPNFFRFHSDGAQWSAGLGEYAYNELGWKTAAIIGDDYSFPYTGVGGFIAEFCGVGGEITDQGVRLAVLGKEAGMDGGVAAVDETLQSRSLHRTGSPLDVVIDLIGAGVAPAGIKSQNLRLSTKEM